MRLDRLGLDIPLPHRPKPLSVLQSKVLKWVNDGCPGSTFEGYSHRIAARALADDRYITISGKGPTWTAKITPPGVELLKGIGNSDADNHTHQSEADLFIQKLTAAGGVLEVDGGHQHAAANDALIRDAMKSALRPNGHKLEITSVGSWQRPKYEARWVRHFPDDVGRASGPDTRFGGQVSPGRQSVPIQYKRGVQGARRPCSQTAARTGHGKYSPWL